MLEGAVMEYAKWIIGLIGGMLLVVAGILLFRMNEVNVFQQQVNYTIERHGGLTPAALTELDGYAVTAFGGYLQKGPTDPTPLLTGTAGKKSSGYFVSELKKVSPEGAPLKYEFKTPRTAGARYGVNITYVVTRQMTTSEIMSAFNASVIGESASRIRGTAAD